MGVFATADDEYRTGLSYLQDSTQINIPAALTYFQAALALDANHVPSNVMTAVLEFMQMLDDDRVRGIRMGLSQNTDSGTLSEFLRSRTGYDIPFDSIATGYHDRKYRFGADSEASDLQGFLADVISDSIPHMEAHLSRAETADTSFDVSGTGIGGSDTYEVDKTDILALHSALLAFKAYCIILTSYNLDMDTDPRDISGETVSFEQFWKSHPNLTKVNHTWADAWTALQSAESKLYDAGVSLQTETDAQDSDWIRRVDADTRGARFVTDTDMSRFDGWHSDTTAKILTNGESYTFRPKQGNAEIGGLAVDFEKWFANPPDSTKLGFPKGIHKSTIWNAGGIIDPTFSGILPGMTMNKLFLHMHNPDTYITLGSTQTFNLNDNTFGWNGADVVDVYFSSISPVTLIRRDSRYSNRQWALTFTPYTSGHHVRVLFDHEDFWPEQTFKIRRPGDFSGDHVQIVPWVASNGEARDAGSSLSAFNTYFSSVSVARSWTNYSADTLYMFVMPNGSAYFDSLATTATKDVGNGTTHLVVSPTALGWFIAGDVATGADSVAVFGSCEMLRGPVSTALTYDFYVSVLKYQVYADTQYGYFSDKAWSALPGAAVTFSILDAPDDAIGHELETTTTTTTSYGYATTRLTLGDVPGIYTVKADVATESGGGSVLMFAMVEGKTRWEGIPDVAGPWYLFSLPRQMSSPYPSTVVEASGEFSSTDWKMYEYNTSTTDYSEPSSLRTGTGYWLKTLGDGDIDLTGGTDLTDTQYVSLAAGWNIIGVPFQQVYTSNQILVKDNNNFVVDMDTAIDSGILDGKFYYWNGSGYIYGPDLTFGYDPWYLFPFRAYWVKATEACQLVFPAPRGSGGYAYAPAYRPAPFYSPNISASGSSAKMLSSSLASASSTGQWTIQLIAQSGRYSDAQNAVGVRAAPPKPVFKSPKPPVGVHLAVTENGAKYASVFSTPQEKNEWDVSVTAVTAGVVTVRAGNIESVPDDVDLTLTDVAAGVQTDLRRSPTYSYYSPAGATRAFRLSTEESGFFRKVKYPAACVIQRTFGSWLGFTGLLRDIRDILMDSSFGRVLTGFYYGAHP